MFRSQARVAAPKPVQTEADLRRIEEVVVGHLERFLWRTPTAVAWEAAR